MNEQLNGSYKPEELIAQAPEHRGIYTAEWSQGFDDEVTEKTFNMGRRREFLMREMLAVVSVPPKNVHDSITTLNNEDGTLTHILDKPDLVSTRAFRSPLLISGGANNEQVEAAFGDHVSPQVAHFKEFTVALMLAYEGDDVPITQEYISQQRETGNAEQLRYVVLGEIDGATGDRLENTPFRFLIEDSPTETDTASVMGELLMRQRALLDNNEITQAAYNQYRADMLQFLNISYGSGQATETLHPDTELYKVMSLYAGIESEAADLLEVQAEADTERVENMQPRLFASRLKMAESIGSSLSRQEISYGPRRPTAYEYTVDEERLIRRWGRDALMLKVALYGDNGYKSMDGSNLRYIGSPDMNTLAEGITQAENVLGVDQWILDNVGDGSEMSEQQYAEALQSFVNTNVLLSDVERTNDQDRAYVRHAKTIIAHCLGRSGSRSRNANHISTSALVSTGIATTAFSERDSLTTDDIVAFIRQFEMNLVGEEGTDSFVDYAAEILDAVAAADQTKGRTTHDAKLPQYAYAVNRLGKAVYGQKWDALRATYQSKQRTFA